MSPEKFIFGCIAACVLAGVGLFGYLVYGSFHALKLKEGTVISKHHSEACYTQTLMPIPFDGGKTTTYLPQTQYYPESWSVTIEGDAPDGEHLTRTIGTNLSDWIKITEGQHLKID